MCYISASFSLSKKCYYRSCVRKNGNYIRIRATMFKIVIFVVACVSVTVFNHEIIVFVYNRKDWKMFDTSIPRASYLDPIKMLSNFFVYIKDDSNFIVSNNYVSVILGDITPI